MYQETKNQRMKRKNSVFFKLRTLPPVFSKKIPKKNMCVGGGERGRGGVVENFNDINF